MLTDSAKYLDRTPQVLDISVFEPGNSNLESGIEDGDHVNGDDGNFQFDTVTAPAVIEEVPPPPPPSLDKSPRDELEAGRSSPVYSPSFLSPRSRKKAVGSSRTATGNQRRVGNNVQNGNERVLIYPPDEDIDPEAELISAASSGRLESVRELLDLWANDLLPFEEHFYPLYMACQSGHFEVAVLLLERNCGSATLASAELDGATALFACAEEGHVDCARLLLAAGADVHALKEDGTTPLLAASARGHATLCAVLLLAGSNVAREKETTGCTALHLACQEGFDEVCSVLLAHGANANAVRFSDGASPLLLAAQEGHLACLEVLLASSTHSASNADEGLDLDALNTHGESALFVACAGGEAECAAALLDHGASVDLETPDGMTGLLFASQVGDDEVVQILLDHGADPNHPKANGHITPLVLATMGGHLDCVRKLLVRGASTKAVRTAKELPSKDQGDDDEGDDEDDDDDEDEEDAVPIGATPLSLAVARGHEDVAALLQLHEETFA